MGNARHAWGWSGHILVCEDYITGSVDDNMVEVSKERFDRIVFDYDNCPLDERIRMERLGVIDSDTYFLASGSPATFSNGYTHYGTVFEEAELRASPGPSVVDHDAEYLAAMKEVYGLDLPPCRLMIGCSSEH